MIKAKLETILVKQAYKQNVLNETLIKGMKTIEKYVSEEK